MAITNKYLKGLYSDTSKEWYTMVIWPDADFSATGASKTIESLTGAAGHIVPYLRMGNTNANSVTGNTYAGELLTTAFDVKLDKTWIWTTGIKAPKISATGVSNVYVELSTGTAALVGPSGNLKITDTGVSIKGPTGGVEITLVKTGTKITGPVTFNNDVSISGTNSDLTVSGAINGASITVSGKCEAQYFNAKSDIRAKEHIKLLNKEFKQSIVNLFDSLIDNFYSFNFKGDDNTTFGLIAQELYNKCVENHIDPHLFVNNINASGENGDYMSINTTALLYALFIYMGELKSYGKTR